MSLTGLLLRTESERERSTARVAAKTRGYARTLRHSIHLRFSLANLICGVLPDFFSGSVRGRLYRWAGFDVGDGAFIMGNVRVTSATPGLYDKLVVGAGATIADRVTINLDERVVLGRDVGIAPEVLIYTGTHRIGPGSRRLGAVSALPVTIEDGAWIRLGAIIVPGVTVGRGAIVAAGAVVLSDVPPNTYVEGNPAVVVRRLGWGNR